MSKILKIILIVVAGLILVTLLLNFFIKREIKSSIEEHLGSVLQYEQIDVDVLQGNVDLEQPEFEKDGKQIEATKLEVNGFSYYQYFMNDKIVIDEVHLESPHAVFGGKAQDTTQKQGNFKQEVEVKTFRSTQGEIRSGKKDSASGLFLNFSNIEISDVLVNSETLKKKIPFNYKGFELQADSLRAGLDPQHFLTTGTISAKNQELVVRSTRIVPKYGEQEFQKHIPFEKDRFEVTIDSIRFDSLVWGFRNKDLFIKNNQLDIVNADMEVYRDKQVQDDPSIKTLYNEKIRNMGVKIDFDSIKIRNSSITYNERTKPTGKPARVSFDGLEADISNLVNIGMDSENFPETRVNASAQFMNESAVVVDWTFDVSNLNNKFTFSGNIDHFSHKALNPIFKPIMHMKVKGSIKNLNFTFTGNEQKAVGDMRLRYENFKLTVLEGGEKEKNEFLSFVSNLFLDNEGVTDDVLHNNMEVHRNRKRSFWNFVWLFLREGAVKTLL